MRLIDLKKTDLFNRLIPDNVRLLDSGSNTNVYKNLLDNSIYLISKDCSKMNFYIFAIKSKFIPKIYGLYYDPLNDFNLVIREECFPIISKRKLTRVDTIKECLQSKIYSHDPIADLLLDFKRENNNFEFDFGPHWLMENSKGKLVICDAFIERK